MNIYLEKMMRDMNVENNSKAIDTVLTVALNDYYDLKMLEEINEEYFIKWAEAGVFTDSEERLEKLKKKPNKKYLIETMKLFLTNKESFEKAFNTMELVVKAAFFMCTWYNGADIATLYKEYKTKIKNIEKTGRVLDVKFRFFKTTNVYIGMQKGEIDLSPVIVMFLREFMIKPPELDIQDLKNIDTKYKENYEKEILENIHLLFDMKKNQDIRLGANGKILKSVMSFFEKSVPLKEMYENTKNEEEKRIKTELIIKIFSALQIESITYKENPEEMLKEIVEKIFSEDALIEADYYYGKKYSINLAKTILSNLKVNLHTYEIEKIKQYMNGLKFVFTEISSKEWITIESMVLFLIINDIAPFTYSKEFSRTIMGDNNLYPYRDRDKVEENMMNYILLPFTKGMMAVMATLGIVEIGYDNREYKEYKEHNSIYNGIKYIKVTELGKYLLGMNQSYEFEQEKSTIEIVLNEKELLMSITGEDRRKEIVIGKIAEPSGANIYRVNNKTLFAGCNKKEDVNSKIENFKRVVGELPENWKNYFKKIEKGFKPLTKLENVVVMSIKDDKELINIIAKDERLKKVILKAEKYHIVVESYKVPYVESILKEYGYF
jgi:hypothetical protein